MFSLLQVHFEDSQFEKRRADGWIKLKPNAIPTLFDDRNSSLTVRIDPPLKKSLSKVTEQNEIAATYIQEVAEVPIIPEIVILFNTFVVFNYTLLIFIHKILILSKMLQNIDYAVPSRHHHDVFRKEEVSNVPNSLLSSDSEQTKENKVCHSFSKYFL